MGSELMTVCALCKDELDTDSPFSIHGLNPETFRVAWMHDQCAIAALESLHGQPSKSVEYEDRYDEFIQFAQEHGEA